MRKTHSHPTLVWFRQDLRLSDNPALAEALKLGSPVIPVYIWYPEEEGDWPPGGASRWWLHHSLAALESELRRRGSRLILRGGAALPTLHQLVSETRATTVLWNRRYEPAGGQRDQQVFESLKSAGILAQTFNGALLHEPWAIRNKSGKPFQVFTPFWKHCLSLSPPAAPLGAPRTIPTPQNGPVSAALQDFGLQPVPDWAHGLRQTWQPGSAGAEKQLQRFLAEAFAEYETGRNRPDIPGTSRLSPHLHFGELSPRQVWHAVVRTLKAGHQDNRRGQNLPLAQSQFVSELGWREFSHHLLHHFPHTPAQPLRAEFSKFRWRQNPEWLRAWQKGQTGYPIVDAGMRELWSTGWMHNRVRMISASFLVKDLLISWQEGARWFWDTLVDADLAQNTLGWQWTAGCGADAAPFFRIFNPVAQGRKFDPEGSYVRRWVPELAGLPNEWIHEPHAAPAEILKRTEVCLGSSYPEPLVNHAIAREIALEAYGRIRAA